jgi:endo-1,4-beta-xylanase
MKWEVIEPFPNVFNFTPADEIVKFAHSVGGKVRGHNFMWYVVRGRPFRRFKILIQCGRGNQLAPWVNSSLTATELDKALKNHIDKIMSHYKGQLYAVDVIVRLSS